MTATEDALSGAGVIHCKSVANKYFPAKSRPKQLKKYLQSILYKQVKLRHAFLPQSRNAEGIKDASDDSSTASLI